MKQENKNRKSVFSKKGFTLLELTIVIAASAIILALSWESLAKSRQDANESAACNELASYINKTRTYALTGKIVNGETPDSFMISTSGSDISIKTDDGTQVEDKYTLKAGISCGNISIKYDVPSGDGVVGSSGPYNCGAKYHVDIDKFKAVCSSN